MDHFFFFAKNGNDFSFLKAGSELLLVLKREEIILFLFFKGMNTVFFSKEG